MGVAQVSRVGHVEIMSWITNAAMIATPHANDNRINFLVLIGAHPTGAEGPTPAGLRNR